MSSDLITTILWILWAVIAIAWIASTFALSYHWKSYSSYKDSNIRAAKRWYYGISVIVLILTAVFILIL